MTTVTATPSLAPSILYLVQRVKRECGLPTPTTLIGTTDQTALVAISALNDAVVEIYTRNRWEWKQSLYAVPLVAGTTQYPLPNDFERICIDPKSGGYPVTGLSQEEWQQILPSMDNTTGSPVYYTTHGLIFEIWPAPSAAYIAQYPNLPFVYYRKPPARLDGTDDSANFNMPPEFEDALVSYGKWKVKEFLEYPDSQSDHQKYEQALQVQLNAGRTMRKNPRMRQGGMVSPKVWS
jgi:hypothetical protein